MPWSSINHTTIWPQGQYMVNDSVDKFTEKKIKNYKNHMAMQIQKNRHMRQRLCPEIGFIDQKKVGKISIVQQNLPCKIYMRIMLNLYE